MSRGRKTIGLLAISVLLMTNLPVTVHAEEGYTYNYDWWEDVQYSPDAYEVAGVFSAQELELDTKLSAPEGLFVYGSMVYL